VSDAVDVRTAEDCTLGRPIHQRRGIVVSSSHLSNRVNRAGHETPRAIRVGMANCFGRPIELRLPMAEPPLLHRTPWPHGDARPYMRRVLESGMAIRSVVEVG
jgi:hypothetical protein